MKITVARKIFNEECTIGEMSIDGTFFAHTMEPVYRNLQGDCSKKIFAKTAIEKGNYKVIVNYSNHFGKKLPYILDVKCFDGVRIHGGNKPADTEGCILIGNNTNGVDFIGGCAEDVQKITDLIQSAGTADLEIIHAELEPEIVAAVSA